MAGGKRASMREGPLAALFRKTETEGLEDAPAEAPAAPPRPSRASDAPTIPTPQERLRHAFSSDLPENMMAPPSPREPAAVEPTTEWDSARGAASAQPQLRVVGVGGARRQRRQPHDRGRGHAASSSSRSTPTRSRCRPSAAHVTLQIGADITRGLGSGSDPDRGRTAAMEDYDRIKSLLKGSDMVFITAGEGGGTGTGAAPVVARIARELGALTVGIVTKPFGFEGSRRLAGGRDGHRGAGAKRSTR